MGIRSDFKMILPGKPPVFVKTIKYLYIPFI